MSAQQKLEELRERLGKARNEVAVLEAEEAEIIKRIASEENRERKRGRKQQQNIEFDGKICRFEESFWDPRSILQSLIKFTYYIYYSCLKFGSLS